MSINLAHLLIQNQNVSLPTHYEIASPIPCSERVPSCAVLLYFSDEGYLQCTINTGTFLFHYRFMFRDKRKPWAHVRKHPLCEYLSPQSHMPVRYFHHSSSSLVACLLTYIILFLCIGFTLVISPLQGKTLFLCFRIFHRKKKYTKVIFFNLVLFCCLRQKVQNDACSCDAL